MHLQFKLHDSKHIILQGSVRRVHDTAVPDVHEL